MTIFRINNFAVKINPILLFLVAIFIYFGYIIEVATMIIIVLLHELIHLISAQKFGIKVKELELFPFGGIGKLDSILGPDPKIEIMVSLSGPIFNIAAAMIFKTIVFFIGNNIILELLIKYNIYVGLFNLIPIFPLDGGRILRAILSYLLGFKASTNMLTYITYCFSIIATAVGSYSIIVNRTGIWLICIALFISIAANKEKKMAAFIFIKEISQKKVELLRKGIMKTQHFIVIGSISACSVLESFLPGKYHIIIVVDNNGNTIGTLNENELFEGILQYGIDVRIEKLLIENEKC